MPNLSSIFILLIYLKIIMLDKYHLNYLYIGEILLALSIIIDVKAPIYTVLIIFYWIETEV